jgi:hypothetical protein
MNPINFKSLQEQYKEAYIKKTLESHISKSYRNCSTNQGTSFSASSVNHYVIISCWILLFNIVSTVMLPFLTRWQWVRVVAVKALHTYSLRPPWSRGSGFKTGGGRRIFKDGKIQGTKSFGRDFKPFDPCSRFTAR